MNLLADYLLPGLMLLFACNGSQQASENHYDPRTGKTDTLIMPAVPDTLVDPLTVVPEATPDPSVQETGSPKENDDPEPPRESPAAATMPAGHYHLVVSFYSPGQGINREGYQAFRQWLAERKEQFIYEETRWGREGEVDFCILYEGENAVFPAKATARIKSFLKGYDRINFTENSPCVHKR